MFPGTTRFNFFKRAVKTAPRRLLLAGVPVLCLAAIVASYPATGVIAIDSRMEPLAWAVLERRVFEASAPAMTEFYRKYYDERGRVQCVLRWGADDGPDDAFENFAGWPEFHALGGSDDTLMYLTGLEGMIQQYAEARTTEVPAGRYGMYYKEFSAQSDWMHHGEGLRVFNRMGLSVQ